MSRTGTIGGATLYLADCREVLPVITGAKCLVTDPPYRVTAGGKTEAAFGGWMRDAYDNSGQIVTCNLEWDDWLPLIPSTLLDAAHLYIFSNDRNLPQAWKAAQKVGFEFHRLLTWNKGTAMPNRWYLQCCEFVLFMRKGSAYRVRDCGVMALQSAYQRDESSHPTEKLVPLLELYIRQSSQPGDLIVDPFMGSGSTGVAAVRQGRTFAGIELEQKWFDIACQRLEAALKQPSLFLPELEPCSSQLSLGR